MNYDRVKTQFGTWAEKLRPFIESEEMDKIFQFLKTRGQQGKVICPHHTDVFRAFRECDYRNLKCVLMGQDPYPSIIDGSYVADGLAFSAAHINSLPPSLVALYEGMEEDLGEGLNLRMHRNPDLGYLAEQGVLLLNSALTVEQDDIGAHAPAIMGTEQLWVWDPFMKFLLDEVLNQYDRTIFVFLGKQAQRYAREPVPFHHHVLEVEHPIAGARSGRPWRHQRIFSRVNHILKMNNGPEHQIQWYRELE